MRDFFKCISLREITPDHVTLSFDRERVQSENAEVTYSIHTDMAESENDKACMLKVKAEAKATQGDLPDIFNLTLGVEYVFDIDDMEAFKSASDEEKLKYSIACVYLDFRYRLTMSMASTGMTGFKLPYSIDKLAKE